MRRPVCWVDKEAPEGKTEIRVSVHADTVKWQFLDAEAENWVYDRRPTEEQWLQLEEKLENLIQRGHHCDAELDLTRRRGKSKKA